MPSSSKKVFQQGHSMTNCKEPQVSYLGLTLVILTPSMGEFVRGVDLGITSFVLEMMRNPLDDTGVWWRNFGSNNVLQGLFVSSLSLGALLGSHLIFVYLARSLGRRTEIRLSALLYILGSMLTLSSGTILRNSQEWLGFSCLILGRLLFGIGVSFNVHGAPIYMSEMCPASIRGSVVTVKEAFVVIGIVAGFAIGDAFSGDPLRWADLYATTTVLTIPVLLMSTFIPRSVRWLLMNGEVDEAKEAMQFVYRSNIDDDFVTLCDQIVATRKSAHHKTNQILFSNSTRQAFTASIGLVALQQLSGQPSILSYVAVLFSAAGLSGNSSVWTAILMACNASFTVSMVDRVGRKILLKAGCVFMLCAVIALSYSFWDYRADTTDEDSTFGPVQQMVVLVAMFVYVSTYQLGYGPITWLVIAELFPLEQRGEASAFLVELNYCLNFLVQFIVPTIQAMVGWGPTFGIFGIILAFSIHFVQTYVPETKGMTLEEIEKKLQVRTSSMSEQDSFSESSSLLPKSDSVELLRSYFGDDIPDVDVHM